MFSVRQAPDTATSLLIVNRLGTVHAVRYSTTCSVAAHAPNRVNISALQALVYKLAPCSACFSNVAEFERLIGRKPKS